MPTNPSFRSQWLLAVAVPLITFAALLAAAALPQPRPRFPDRGVGGCLRPRLRPGTADDRGAGSRPPGGGRR